MHIASYIATLASELGFTQQQWQSLGWIGFSLAIELVVLVRLGFIIHRRYAR